MIRKVVIADGDYGVVSPETAARYKELSGKDLKTRQYTTYKYDSKTRQTIPVKCTKWLAPEDREDLVWVQVIEEGFNNELYSIDTYDDEYQTYDIDIEYIGYDTERLIRIPILNIDKLMSLQTRKEVEEYLNKLEVKYK